eukprot:560734-Pleurochrysis_carterae.AAC.1
MRRNAKRASASLSAARAGTASRLALRFASFALWRSTASRQLVALGHEWMVKVTGIRERLAARVAVARFSVHRLIVSETASTLVRVKAAAQAGRCASAVIVG